MPLRKGVDNDVLVSRYGSIVSIQRELLDCFHTSCIESSIVTQDLRQGGYKPYRCSSAMIYPSTEVSKLQPTGHQTPRVLSGVVHNNSRCLLLDHCTGIALNAEPYLPLHMKEDALNLTVVLIQGSLHE